jgi:hypothetical protein
VAPGCHLRPTGAINTYPTELKTEDYTARTMEGGCCFGNVEMKIYMKLSRKNAFAKSINL